MALDLHRFYEEHKFKFDDKLAYGVYRNRVLSIVPVGNYIKVTIPFSIQLSKEQGQAISTKYRELKQLNRILQHALTTNVYVELLFYQSADINQEFLKVLNDCLTILDNQNISTCEICPICGQQLHTNDPFVRIRDSVLQGHDNCIEQFISSSTKFEQKIESNNKNSFIKTSIISLLSLILVVLIICATSLIGAYKYFVIFAGIGFILLTRYLLRKFKVILDKKQIVIMCVFAFLTTILSVYLGSSIMLFKGNMIALSLQEILLKYPLIFIENYETLGKIVLLDIIVNFIGIGILMYSNIKMMSYRKTNVHKLK